MADNTSTITAHELLIEDHERLKKIFSKLEDASDKKEYSSLMEEVVKELGMHAMLEEQYYYPKLKDVDTTHDLTLEAYEEHHTAEEKMYEIQDELKAGTKEVDEIKAMITVFMEEVKHHIKEEQDELFPKAEQVLSNEELVKIAELMMAAKEKQMKTSDTMKG